MVKLVGILNVTPDSFSDGGEFLGPENALAHTKQLFADGASLVDVGAESTRPNATPLSADEEWERLAQVLPPLLAAYPGQISLDSYHPETMQRAFEFGPVILNDVTGLRNPVMQKLAVSLHARVIISHHPDMSIQQSHALQPITTIEQVKNDLLVIAAQLIEQGLPKENIILDPGIGFGKTMELNQQLLTFAEQVPDYPVLIGYSRKRFLGDDRMALAPNLAAGRTAVNHGAAYLRVHDVAGHANLVY